MGLCTALQASRLVSRRGCGWAVKSPVCSAGVQPPVRSAGVDLPTPRIARLLRRGALLGGGLALSCGLPKSAAAAAYKAPPARNERMQFERLDNGLRVLVLREGSLKGTSPSVGDQVAVHYYARLVAKQGWRFDSSYDNLDRFGEAIPFSFTVGDEGVIEGLNLMVLNMREGSVVRVVIPGDKGYQNRQQQPIPREFSDRQRLYTTIFNPTRIANGEGETLGALIFDLELLSVRPK